MFLELPEVFETSCWRNGEQRSRVPIRCPHCQVVFVKLPTNALKAHKAGKCAAHLLRCKVYQNSCSTEAQAPALPKTLAPAPQPTVEHDALKELDARLEAERAAREAERGQFNDERKEFVAERCRFETERKELLAKLETERTTRATLELERATATKLADERCLVAELNENLKAVRDWGNLQLPDHTLVEQLKKREANADRQRENEIQRAKRTFEIAYDEIIARVSTLERDNARLKRRRIEYKLPEELMSDSEWARKRAMIAFAPDKQPSEATKQLALPFFKQASAAAPSRTASHT